MREIGKKIDKFVPVKNKELEKDIERRVVSYCNYHHILCAKWQNLSNMGVPDRILASAGIVLFLEIKRESGELRPSQKGWKDKLQNAGCLWRCGYGYGDCIKIINNVFQIKKN